MRNYGRRPNRLTNPKRNHKRATLKRGKIAPAWNVGLQMKKRNPAIYIDPFRAKLTPHSPIIPPNFKLRLQTFHLNVRNRIKEDIIFLRRPTQGITNLKVPVLQCAAIYRKIREVINTTDEWGEEIILPEIDRNINNDAVADIPSTSSESEENVGEEDSSGYTGTDEPVIDEPEDDNAEDSGTNAEKNNQKAETDIAYDEEAVPEDVPESDYESFDEDESDNLENVEEEYDPDDDILEESEEEIEESEKEED